jgi:TolB-like protein/class 3 adenylate cyclase/tetratricopeptide (TPR) repeat protein
VSETRKLAAILVSDVVGYSRLAGADEDRILARLRTLRSDLIDPTIAVHHGRVVKRTGDGAIVEFRSAVDAVNFAVEIQSAMVERNAEVAPDKRVEFRIGIHIGDVVEESDGDLMGDGVNIAARLQGVAKPGGICISDDTYRQVKSRLDLKASDLGPVPLKNIAEPMRVYALILERSAAKPYAGPAETASNLALPDKPSIAVLPFQNMSGDPEQDYFADGMSEDIVTGLSRIKWLFVIARNSSFVYKGKAVDVRQVGRELGVRYIVEGGVRKSGNRLRVTAQLVEAETGAHLWANRYDGSTDDIFDFQDRITDSVVGIVEPSMQRSEIERARRKRPDSLSAYDLYLRALPHTATSRPESATIAIKLLEEALTLDSDYVAAHALIAWFHEKRFARTGLNEVDRAAGLSHAGWVIGTSTDDATALAIAGFVTALLSGGHEAALNAIDRALASNPSCATALYLAAQVHSILGHSEKGTAYANRALRQSPFDFLVHEAYVALGNAALTETRFEDAASFYGKAVQSSPKIGTYYFFQAIALALAGRIEEARPLTERGFEFEPQFRVRWIRDMCVRELADKFVKGGRLLTLPE